MTGLGSTMVLRGASVLLSKGLLVFLDSLTENASQCIFSSVAKAPDVLEGSLVDFCPWAFIATPESFLSSLYAFGSSDKGARRSAGIVDAFSTAVVDVSFGYVVDTEDVAR